MTVAQASEQLGKIESWEEYIWRTPRLWTVTRISRAGMWKLQSPLRTIRRTLGHCLCARGQHNIIVQPICGGEIVVFCARHCKQHKEYSFQWNRLTERHDQVFVQDNNPLSEIARRNHAESTKGE